MAPLKHGKSGKQQRHRQANAQDCRDQSSLSITSATLPVVERHAGVQEITLQCVQIALAVLAPLQGLRQARAPKQGLVFSMKALPLTRRLIQSSVRSQCGAVVIQPLPQARPVANQSFVGDLDRALVCPRVGRGDEQTRPRQRIDDSFRFVTCSAHRYQFGHRCTPARVLSTVAWLSQSKEQTLGDGLLSSREMAVDAFGTLRERPLDSADARITLERQRVASTMAPQLHQRILQQRQRARLAGHVIHDRIHQAGLERQPVRWAGPSIAC
jgi:hypothetical protein